MSAIDDINQNIDDLTQSVTDHDSRIAVLEQYIPQDGTALRAQLDFPADDQTSQTILGLFISGAATLAAGTVTVTDPRVGTSSTVIVTVTNPGGTRGNLSVSLGSGSFTINSTSATETSTVNYLILP